MFIPLDEPIQVATSEVLGRFARLVGEAANRTQADPFVIATAKVRGLTVITEESRGSDGKPRIPLVCEAFGVPCINALTFLRQTGWKAV